MILEDYESFISVNIGASQNYLKKEGLFRTKKTTKINDFGGLFKFGGPYEPVYEPFYAGFEENFNMSIDLIVLKNYFDLGIRT
jgi:hypothetical protein